MSSADPGAASRPSLGDAGDVPLRNASQTKNPSGWQALISKRVVCDMTQVADIAVVFFSALFAKYSYLTTILGVDVPLEIYALIGGAGALLSSLLLRKRGVYRFENLARGHNNFANILFGLAIAFLILVGFGYVLKASSAISRGWYISWFFFSTFGVLLVHSAVSRFVGLSLAKGFFVRNVVIFGTGPIAEKLSELIDKKVHPDMRLVGIYDDRADPRSNVTLSSNSGGLSDLIRYAQSHPIDEVLIALPLTDEVRINNLVNQLSILPIDIRLCPTASPLLTTPRALHNYSGLPVLELESRPLDDWGPLVKLMEDYVLGAMMIIFFAPIMLLIAVAIKIDSAGPVFFRQRRHGFNHQVITVLKFRTMVVAQDGANVPQAKRDDPRVTRVGRFLRKTSLDELPQLINVLRGEMSLVGPRPHALSHNEHYSAHLENYANRHKVKPGLTGWAQVNGFRGETETPEKMRCRVECDLYYINNWSLWFDIKIILMTPFFALTKNAF